jgi:membrane-associated phospholipid phosphatase
MRHFALCLIVLFAVAPAQGQEISTPFWHTEKNAHVGVPTFDPVACDSQADSRSENQSNTSSEPEIGVNLLSQIIRNQKEVWKFPLKLTHGEHWKPALIAIAATTALVEIDPHDAPYFRRTQSFVGFNKTFSSRNTGIAEGLFPAVFYLAARARDDSYARETGVMSMVALADSEIVAEIAKNAIRRRRPLDISPDGDFTHTWFRAGPGFLVSRGSFTSGHATGAFAIAAVFADRYHQHHWVPWAAYGLASLVAFSRVSNQNHFPSDVFAGAVLGYSISHFVVLRR